VFSLLVSMLRGIKNMYKWTSASSTVSLAIKIRDRKSKTPCCPSPCLVLGSENDSERTLFSLYFYHMLYMCMSYITCAFIRNIRDKFIRLESMRKAPSYRQGEARMGLPKRNLQRLFGCKSVRQKCLVFYYITLYSTHVAMVQDVR
jgi:hypothetical protein